jgi:hypothetical protein
MLRFYPLLLSGALASFVAGCSGSPVSPLGSTKTPGMVCVDGGCQPCGGAGEACCDDDTTGMTFVTEAGVHGGGKNYYCSESAGVPCSKRLLCETCGGSGERVCAAGIDVDAGAAFPQPDFCLPGLADNLATGTCETCGGHGQPCCITVPECATGECGGDFFCPAAPPFDSGLPDAGSICNTACVSTCNGDPQCTQACGC